MLVSELKRFIKIMKLNTLLFDNPKYELAETYNSTCNTYIITNLLAVIENDMLILSGEEDYVVEMLLGSIVDIQIGKNEFNIMLTDKCINIKMV